jgi:hypothetical protein
MLKLNSRVTIAVVLGCAAVAVAGCTSYNNRVSPGVWDADVASTPYTPPPPVSAPIRPSAPVAPPPRLVTTQRGSVTAGCDGTFTLMGANGAVSSQGRAHNTGAGLVRLDARGNRGASIPAASNGESLLFRPDCNCQSVREVSDAGGAAPMCNAG